MSNLLLTARRGASCMAFVLVGACSSAGGLGSVLSGVLGGGAQANQANQANRVAGVIRGVDARSQQINLEQSNGQAVPIAFDNRTVVIYQNKAYAVTNLENGDQVTVRVQSTQNGGYYTDSVFVTQSVNNNNTTGGSTTGSNNVQSLQGTVRQVDRTNGLFTLEANSNVTLTVSMPYNASRNDVTRFQNLRSGDSVRLYGVFLNNSRVELRQFY